LPRLTKPESSWWDVASGRGIFAGLLSLDKLACRLRPDSASRNCCIQSVAACGAHEPLDEARAGEVPKRLKDIEGKCGPGYGGLALNGRLEPASNCGLSRRAVPDCGPPTCVGRGRLRVAPFGPSAPVSFPNPTAEGHLMDRMRRRDAVDDGARCDAWRWRHSSARWPRRSWRRPCQRPCRSRWSASRR
jgi:hypothetical protein